MSNGATTQQPKRAAAPIFHFAAGLGSGVFSAFLLQPADLLKTRVQQDPSSTSSLSSALRNVLASPNPVRQLWRGTLPSVIRTGGGSALYFGMLNQIRTYAASMPSIPLPGEEGGVGAKGKGGGTSSLPKLGNVANLATGAAARVAAGLIVNPVTVLKVRYESSHYNYTSLAGAARDIFAREGLKGFFAGFGVTAIRDAPYAGLYVLIYEQSKARLASATGKTGGNTSAGTGSSATINFASGMLAAIAATTLTNPFDAIKTRLQIAPAKYRNVVQGAKLMLRDEGMRSMFSGLSLRLGRKAVSSALTWTVYEELVRRAERVVV